MTVSVSSVGLKGLEGYLVEVEVRITPGTESVTVVGLPDASVKESRERVIAAMSHFDADVTDQKIVVSLLPSEQKKNGPLFDLAIAIAALKELNVINWEIASDTAFPGALTLNGRVKSAEGMLPALVAAQELGIKTVYFPYDSLLPIEMFDHDLECIVVHHIQEVVNHLEGQERLDFHPPFQPTALLSSIAEPKFKDFRHVIGHQHAKRALEIAAAGEHNVLMSGPPGCGKSLLAETLPSILPPLTKKAQLDVMSLYQLGGEKRSSLSAVPFRSPHIGASSVAIIGGGSSPRPGEISLAHRGCCFSGEIAEFPRKTLDMLRQPLEAGTVTISRAHSTVSYPSAFLLVAAMNPCPCGYLDSNSHYCVCTPKQIHAYQTRLSGPVYDRIDILLTLKSVSLDQQTKRQESSSEIRRRVERARELQYQRYEKEISNAKVPFEILSETSPLTLSQQELVTRVAAEEHWSNRVQIKITRLARTIADLAEETTVSDRSLQEAFPLRRMNKKQSSVIRQGV